MCGDYCKRPIWTWSREGSPPHVRGLLRVIFSFPLAVRITPACAGTTTSVVAISAWPRDHPRMCGDYGGAGIRSASLLGSPPHVRGLQYPRCGEQPGVRITPACAGTTAPLLGDLLRPRDHPRMCGDYKAEYLCTMNKLGSPPHVRGLQNLKEMFCCASRITPACAGTTISVATMVCSVLNHPRMCGDYYSRNFFRQSRLGSPPHVRGLRYPGR